MIEFATIARPYAKAVFELAKEHQSEQNWLVGLEQLAWLAKQSQVAALIDQVQLSAKDKVEQILALLDGQNFGEAQTALHNFVRVLADENRLTVLPEIYEQYRELVLSDKNIKEAVVYTAFDVADEAQRAEIINSLEKYFGVKLQAAFKTDPSLIGGIKAEVGDRMLDLSVQGKLQQLYAAMTN